MNYNQLLHEQRDNVKSIWLHNDQTNFKTNYTANCY